MRIVEIAAQRCIKKVRSRMKKVGHELAQCGVTMSGWKSGTFGRLEIVESKDNLISIAVLQVEKTTAIEGDRMALCRFFSFMLKLQDMKTDELRHDIRVPELIALSFVVGMIESPQFL